MANNKRIPPKRTDLLVENHGFPSRRASKFFESLTDQIDPIVDLTGTPSNDDLRDAINTILEGLRTVRILEQ